MAEFLDSFDDRVTADIGNKYISFSVVSAGGGSYTVTITSAAGRNGTNGLRFARNSGIGIPTVSLVQAMPNNTRYKMAFARRWSTLPIAGSYRAIAGMRDSGTTQCELRLYSDGSLRLYRSGSLVTGGQSVGGLIVPNVFYHFEWDLTVHNTTGASELRINETTTAFTVTNQNTRTSANNQINELEIKTVQGDSNDSSWNDDIDDFVFHDQTGFVGDLRVGCQNPSGAGTYADWTSNGAGTNVGCVSESTQDGDTTYISDATIGHKATFNFADLPVSATVKFVQHVIVAKKTDAGTRSFAPYTKSSATETAGTDISPGTTYAYLRQMGNTDPATGVAWTASGFNAAEFGVEVTA